MELNQTVDVAQSEQESMPTYCRVSVVRATPMDELTYLRKYENHEANPDRQYRDGYLVIDELNQVKWVSLREFQSFRRMTTEELSLIAKDAVE